MRFRLPAIVFTGFLCSFGRADTPTDIDALRDRFTPALPTVALTYQVSYRLLHMNLIRMAQARVETTEGYWMPEGSTNRIRSCYMEINLQTPDRTDDTSKRSRVSIHDKIISVVTMPDLNTLYFVKRSDESIRVPFKKAKRINSLQIYDLESGSLNFFSKNFVTGNVCTNLQGGSVNMAAQGREVIDVLKSMSEVYANKAPAITPDSDFRVYVNCDGKAVPFAAKTQRDSVRLLGEKWNALRCDVMPAKEAPRVRSRDFTMHAVSLNTFADVVDNPVLMDIAKQTPDWSMTPLLVDYELTLGYIRCLLSKVETIDQTDLPKKIADCHKQARGEPLQEKKAGKKM